MPWLTVPLTWIALAASSLTSSTPRAVSFDQAIGLAEQAPDVQGARRAVSEQRALAGAIGPLAHNPQLTVQPGVRLAQPDARGFEIQASLTQSWSLAGLGEARREAVRAEGGALAAAARARALSQRLAAARVWIDLWEAQRLLAVARREAEVAAELLSAVEKAAAAEAATRADVADARAYLAEARLQGIQAEGEVTERSLALSRELADAGAAPLAAAGELPAPALPPEGRWASLVQRAGRLPEVEARQLEARAERARLVEERAARGAQLSLGVAVQRDQPSGFVVYGLAGVTLPVFDAGERERSAIAGRAATLEGQAARARSDGRAELRWALHEVEHSGEVLAAVRDQLLPAVEEGIAARERIYRAGDATLLEVLQGRRQGLAARGRLEQARAREAWARVKAWLLLSALEEGSSAARRAGGKEVAR